MWVYFQPDESKLEIRLANKGNYRQYFNELREKYFETYACTTDIEVNWPDEYLTRFNTILLICSHFLTCSDLLISRLEEDTSLLINLLDKDNTYTDFFCSVNNEVNQPKMLFRDLNYYNFPRMHDTLDDCKRDISKYVKSVLSKYPSSQ